MQGMIVVLVVYSLLVTIYHLMENGSRLPACRRREGMQPPASPRLDNYWSQEAIMAIISPPQNCSPVEDPGYLTHLFLLHCMATAR